MPFETDHKQNEAVRCEDPVHHLSPIKVLHGVCHHKKEYRDKQDLIALVLKLLCKTINEWKASFLCLSYTHMKPQRNARQITFEHELHIDLKGPVVTMAVGPLA